MQGRLFQIMELITAKSLSKTEFVEKGVHSKTHSEDDCSVQVGTMAKSYSRSLYSSSLDLDRTE